MSFPYKCVLMIGATSGIGHAMAEKLVQSGTQVIVVGRRKDRLEAFVSKHGEEHAGALAFDINDTAGLPQFVKTITNTYSELDCVFLNAGTQGVYDFSKPSEVNLAGFHAEIAVNFTSFVNITHAFLPFLMSKQGKANPGIIYTDTHLSTVPAAPIPAYSASKAALNSFMLCLRDQLRNTNVNVISLWPPPVQTEIHDYMGEEAGRKFGMPLDTFTEDAFKELCSGKDQIIIENLGPGTGIIPREEFIALVDKRRSTFAALAKLMRGEH